ncbi:MAG: 4Fe-4S binding protein [Methanobacterium sp. ERen5]|nr:MAG: 4Fe-4S binding protein [Methanobacterium sp. ERen5]
MSCPVDAIWKTEDGKIEIDDKCVGCVLCREACPYNAINMKTTLSEPIRENVPNINTKLCRQCGACVKACKTGSIQLISSGNEEAHSEINEDTCVRCGYCARVCPTEAIKYGEILPRSVVGGKAIVVNQKDCIGCMTCTKVCPSRGAINVGKVSKLPFINPSYCARCEECMNVCPSAAIKYSSRKRAYKNFSKIKTMEIVSELLENEAGKLSKDAIRISSILNGIARKISSNHSEKSFREDVTPIITEEIKAMTHNELEIEDINEIIGVTNPKRSIKVLEDNCIGCGACMSECPVKCIELEMPSPVHIDDRCVHCGKCIETCQFDAIELAEEYFKVENGKIFFKRDALTGQREGKIVTDVAACMACGICVRKCPTNALRLEKDEVLVDTEKCILCGECDIICTVNAIKLKTESNTASNEDNN